MRTNQRFSWKIAALTALAAASTAQADPTLRTVTIGGQSPTSASPGGKAMYSVAVTRTGGGSLSAYLSVSGLPPGATASLVPPQLTFTDQDPSTKNAVLLVALSIGTKDGTYPLTLTARKGNSQNIVTCNFTLTVGSKAIILPPPVLFPPVLNSDGSIGLSGSGTASEPVLIEATTNLVSAASWEPIGVYMLDDQGLFSVIDQDAKTLPLRFYRAAQ